MLYGGGASSFASISAAAADSFVSAAASKLLVPIEDWAGGGAAEVMSPCGGTLSSEEFEETEVGEDDGEEGVDEDVVVSMASCCVVARGCRLRLGATVTGVDRRVDADASDEDVADADD